MADSAEFEWDDEKAASNAEKHGVTFEQACFVFRDPFAVELLDDRENYGEDRFILIGMAADSLLVFIYTERNDRNRIISARKAEPNERRFYHEQNQ
ncbi:MAG: BrnT family toxin [Proteobacteria bacterium]|nr:BrnT family toxin [Pseudomonadota bacterium]